MSRRLEIFVYCAITALVTAFVMSVGTPKEAYGQPYNVPREMTITHKIVFGEVLGTGTRVGDALTIRDR